MTPSTPKSSRHMSADNLRALLRPALLLLLVGSLGFGCASNIAPNVAQYEDGVRKQFAALASIEQSSRALQQTVVLYRAAHADGADDPVPSVAVTGCPERSSSESGASMQNCKLSLVTPDGKDSLDLATSSADARTRDAVLQYAENLSAIYRSGTGDALNAAVRNGNYSARLGIAATQDNPSSTLNSADSVTSALQTSIDTYMRAAKNRAIQAFAEDALVDWRRAQGGADAASSLSMGNSWSEENCRGQAASLIGCIGQNYLGLIEDELNSISIYVDPGKLELIPGASESDAGEWTKYWKRNATERTAGIHSAILATTISGTALTLQAQVRQERAAIATAGSAAATPASELSGLGFGVATHCLSKIAGKRDNGDKVKAAACLARFAQSSDQLYQLALRLDGTVQALREALLLAP